MFDAMKPTIEGNIQGGFDKGIASMQEGLDSMNAQMDRAPAPAAAAMAAQRDELQTVVSQMEEARDAVPAMLDEAKENYLTEVDNDAAEIQEAYQQTMSSGNNVLVTRHAALISVTMMAATRNSRVLSVPS